MIRQVPQPDARSRRPSGFTLVEVMMAMFILALGMVAVASIFPVASLLQRRSQENIITRQLKDSVAAQLAARGVILGEDLSPTQVSWFDTSGTAVTRMRSMINPHVNAQATWPLGTRCFPTVGVTDDSDYTNRLYYWVPLLQDADNAPGRLDWKMLVFLMRRPEGYDLAYDNLPSNLSGIAEQVANEDPPEVPKVILIRATLAGSTFSFDNDRDNNKLPDLVLPGEQVLAIDGTICSVIDADATSITVSGSLPTLPPGINTWKLWIAPSHEPGAPSPLRRIFALGSEVIK